MSGPNASAARSSASVVSAKISVSCRIGRRSVGRVVEAPQLLALDLGARREAQRSAPREHRGDAAAIERPRERETALRRARSCRRRARSAGSWTRRDLRRVEPPRRERRGRSPPIAPTRRRGRSWRGEDAAAGQTRSGACVLRGRDYRSIQPAPAPEPRQSLLRQRRDARDERERGCRGAGIAAAREVSRPDRRRCRGPAAPPTCHFRNRPPPGLRPARLTPMTLDPEICWRAWTSRDRRFDGRFFMAVTSTGIYCRPGCPARTPARRNVRFYRLVRGGRGGGLPALPALPARDRAAARPRAHGTSATVARALRLIDEGALDDGSVETPRGPARRLVALAAPAVRRSRSALRRSRSR